MSAPGLVPRRGHRAQPDARRPRAGHRDLRPLALGQEDNSLWKIWDKPLTPIPSRTSPQVEPGYDVDTEGEGDILRITRKCRRPSHRHHGRRRPPSRCPATSASPTRRWTPTRSPTPSTQYGYHPKEGRPQLRRRPRPRVDAEDPRHPQAVPRRRHLLHDRRGGAEQRRPHAARLPRRPRDRQPHLHPSRHQRNLAAPGRPRAQPHRALFAAELGVQPLYFRPPYSIDQEPDTNDQAAPADRIQQPRLRHRRRQDRHRRLGRASPQDAPGDRRQRLPADRAT
jgi:hypothetical protein